MDEIERHTNIKMHTNTRNVIVTKLAAIAQLVVQHICNVKVRGSTPRGGTKLTN